MKVYRNIPLIDTKGFKLKSFFLFQRAGKRFWLELPFIGFTWRMLILVIFFASCSKHIDEPKPETVTEVTIFVCDEWGISNGSIRPGGITPGLGKPGPAIEPSKKICIKGHFEKVKP